MSTVLRASPPPQAARPIPRGRPVEGHAPSPLGVSRVALDLRVPTCRRHYPGGPLGSDRSWGGLFQPFPIHPQRRRPSPSDCKVGVHIGRFEACSTFTRVTACRLAASPKRHICLEGSDGFVSSTAAPIATGWSDPVAGWELHPLKSQHLFTAHNRSDPKAPPGSVVVGEFLALGAQPRGDPLDRGTARPVRTEHLPEKRPGRQQGSVDDSLSTSRMSKFCELRRN